MDQVASECIIYYTVTTENLVSKNKNKNKIIFLVYVTQDLGMAH